MNIKLYEVYSGHELQIAELIQRRRLQLLVHSCLYYEMDINLVSDRQWDIWAKELVQLQEQYPSISENVIYHNAFKDWDASTGAFLPLQDPWVVRKAQMLGGKRSVKSKPVTSKPIEPKPFKITSKVTNPVTKRKLF